jgi:peptide/nickel transport system permease protein
MWRVIVSRLGGAIAALFVLSLVAFSMVRLLPGNISDALLGVEGSIEARQAIIERYGLDKPLPLQYLKWLGNALHGDLGLTATQRPVLDAISSRIQPSVSLALVGIAMSVIISLTLGTLAGLRRNT